ncbi:MAG: hypothetical protein ACK4OO_00465 [bacterium]
MSVTNVGVDMRKRDKKTPSSGCPSYGKDLASILSLEEEHPLFKEWREHSLSCSYCQALWSIRSRLQQSYALLSERYSCDLVPSWRARIQPTPSSVKPKWAMALGWSILGMVSGIVLGLWVEESLRARTLSEAYEWSAFTEIVSRGDIEEMIAYLEGEE